MHQHAVDSEKQSAKKIFDSEGQTLEVHCSNQLKISPISIRYHQLVRIYRFFLLKLKMRLKAQSVRLLWFL